jgi:NAD(P)-dependent dehydrogenase (short-subunit alcohol dehydrogenase family)
MSSTACYDLRDKVALATGGAQGLGLAIAAELARCGAAVWLGDLQDEKARAAAETLCRDELRADAIGLNVTDSASVDAAMAHIAAEAGRIDILVNSAGVGQTVTPIIDLSDAEWNRVLEVTLTGTFRCCRAAARIMAKQESGAIVNLASVNGQNPAGLVAAYNVAKAGVISLTRSLALEVAAYGVRVNAVSPGPVYTDFNRGVMSQRCVRMGITEPELIERIRASIPLGRWGEPSDIADAVAFLCSSRASWMTGEILRVSGGLEGVAAPVPRTRT